MINTASFDKRVFRVINYPVKIEPFTSEIFLNFQLFHKFAYYTFLTPYTYRVPLTVNLNGKHVLTVEITTFRKVRK